MQTESRTNKKTLNDFNIQGSNLDLKYSGPYTNINTTEVLCSLATLPQLLLVETGKTESKLPQLSIPCFPFSPPSLLRTLYFVLFSWSFDCKISNLQILSQREIRRTCKQIFPCVLTGQCLLHTASLCSQHINFSGLPGLHRTLHGQLEKPLFTLLAPCPLPLSGISSYASKTQLAFFPLIFCWPQLSPDAHILCISGEIQPPSLQSVPPCSARRLQQPSTANSQSPCCPRYSSLRERNMQYRANARK